MCACSCCLLARAHSALTHSLSSTGLLQSVIEPLNDTTTGDSDRIAAATALLETEAPSIATVAADSSAIGSAAAEGEGRAAASTAPPIHSTSAPATPTTTEPSSAPPADGHVVTDASYRRDSKLSAEGIIGIVAASVAVVALAIAFVRVGASKRTQQKEYVETPVAPQDLASSTMSNKDVKYVDSFDSPATTPRASIASLRKPSVPRRSLQLTSDSAAQQHDPHAGASPSLEYTISTTEPEPSLFTPSRVRTFSRSHRSDSLKRAPLSPESYLSLAQSSGRQPFRQSRRSRQSRAVSRESPRAAVMSPSARRPSRLRFSRSSIQSSDSASEIPMLGGDRNTVGAVCAPDAGDDDSHCHTRDIPVLARGSEESVDSIEDDDIEISI